MDSFLVGRNGGGLPESGAGVHGLYDRLPLAKPLRIHPRAKGNHFASDPESDQGARRPAGQGTLGLRRIGNGRPFRLPGTGRFGTMVSVLRKREPGVRFQRPEGQKDRRHRRSSGPGQRFLRLSRKEFHGDTVSRRCPGRGRCGPRSPPPVTLGEGRPVGRPEVIEAMMKNASLLIAAWSGSPVRSRTSPMSPIWPTSPWMSTFKGTGSGRGWSGKRSRGSGVEA